MSTGNLREGSKAKPYRAGRRTYERPGAGRAGNTWMKAMVRRVCRLEDRFQNAAAGPKSSLGIIVTLAGSEANLATSTCARYVRDGLLTEVVYLDGAMGSISDEELEAFVARFPVDPGRAR